MNGLTGGVAGGRVAVAAGGGGKPGDWAQHRVPRFASRRWSARDGDDKAELLVGAFFGAGCGVGVALEELAIRLGGFPAFQNTILCNQDETSDDILILYIISGLKKTSFVDHGHFCVTHHSDSESYQSCQSFTTFVQITLGATKNGINWSKRVIILYKTTQLKNHIVL